MYVQNISEKRIICGFIFVQLLMTIIIPLSSSANEIIYFDPSPNHVFSDFGNTDNNPNGIEFGAQENKKEVLVQTNSIENESDDFDFLSNDTNQNKISDDLDEIISRINSNNNGGLLRVLVFLTPFTKAGDDLEYQELISTINQYNFKINQIIDETSVFNYKLISLSVNHSNISILNALIQSFTIIRYVKIESQGASEMQYGLTQGQIYPDLHENYGLKGDNYSTIAIIDSGIDESHPMFGSYGEKDFSNKIVGWVDFTSEHRAQPYDITNHGTFVASVAAGNPYSKTDAQGRMITSRSIYRDWSSYKNFIIGNSYLDILMSFNVSAPGDIMINGSWKKYSEFSQTTVQKISIIKPDGTYAANTTITVEEVNTIVQYTADASELGVYKVAFVYNVSGLDNNRYYLYANAHYPFSNDFPAAQLQGVAPNAKLVVLKVLYESEYISAFNWILENGTLYNITTINMSFRIDSPTVRALAAQLVNNGYIAVAAAGNEYYGANYAGSTTNTPSCVDTVISVGSIDNRNHIASYSSQGGSTPTGLTIKPDCVAPGGDFASRYTDIRPMIGADSNDGDYPEDPLGNSIIDRVINDTRPAVGTSFSCAYLSGVTQLVIEAMGGYNNWNYSKSEVLKIKSLLLMTATETAPNLRNGVLESSIYNPVLNRGEKDVHEGYGKINPKTAIDVFKYTLTPNSTSVKQNLTSVTEDIYWASTSFGRSIILKNNHYYKFNLTVPSIADFDLYIYNNTPNPYGEPIIVAQSTNAGNGIDEIFQFSPYENNTYYLVIKSVSGSGEFELSYTDYVDISNPSVAQIYSPHQGDYLRGIETFTIYCNDLETRVDTIELYAIQLDNETQSQILDTLLVTNRDYIGEFSFATSNLVDGYYNFTLTAIDANNNRLNSSSILLCIDNTAPNQIIINKPLSESFAHGRILIEATVDDLLSGIERVEFYAFSLTEPISVQYLNDGQTLVSFKWESSVNDDGFNYLWVRAYDKAGNYNSSEEIRLYIENERWDFIYTISGIFILAVSAVIEYKVAEIVLVKFDIFTIPQKIVEFRDGLKRLLSDRKPQSNRDPKELK